MRCRTHLVTFDHAPARDNVREVVEYDEDWCEARTPYDAGEHEMPVRAALADGYEIVETGRNPRWRWCIKGVGGGFSSLQDVIDFYRRHFRWEPVEALSDTEWRDV